MYIIMSSDQIFFFQQWSSIILVVGFCTAPVKWTVESSSLYTWFRSFHPYFLWGIHARLLVYLSRMQSMWCGSPMAAGMASNQRTQMSQGQPHIFCLVVKSKKSSAKWISYFTLFKWVNRTQLKGYYLSAIVFQEKKKPTASEGLIQLCFRPLIRLLLSLVGGRLSFWRTAEIHSSKAVCFLHL